MRRKILAVAAALVLGTATIALDAMAAGRGGGGGAGHSFSGGHRGYSYGSGYRRGYGRGRYGRGYGYGLYWYPNYGYDYGPTDAFGDVTSATLPPVRFVPEPPRAPVICKETVTVPSEDGGTRQIRIIRC
jgi:hypothetical protein